MKKKACFKITLVLLAALACLSALALDINASGCALIEAETGRVLFQQNGDRQLPMASTTKIMTALLAIEKGNLSDVITVPPSASGVEGSSMYLGAGEHITLEDLLYGLMLWSGNDAAVAIAQHIGGSVEGFAQLMNQRAKELGASSTNFVNPNGLPADGHYTTAIDLAQIARCAMQQEAFSGIVSTKTRNVKWEGHEWDRALKNKNKLLYNYQGASGIKTGYTKAAGRCLVSSAEREGVKLISVVLNCPDMYTESSRLLDHGFSQLTRRTAAKKGDVLAQINIKNCTVDVLELSPKDDIVVSAGQDDVVEVTALPLEGLSAPMKAGDRAGTAIIAINGQKVMEQALYLAGEAPERTVGFYLTLVGRDFCKGLFGLSKE